MQEPVQSEFDGLEFCLHDKVCDDDCCLAIQAMMGRLKVSHKALGESGADNSDVSTFKDSGYNEDITSRERSTRKARSKFKSSYTPDLLPQVELCLTFDSHLSTVGSKEYS